MMEIKVGKRVLAISNPEKILFPKKGSLPAISKQKIIHYYQLIAPTMMPHIKNRLITMQRFPDGIHKEGFYQKDASDFFPSWIDQQPVKKESGGVVNYVIATDPATIVYLANLACITPHIWLSRVDKLNFPDRMIFDFDPSPRQTFADIRWAACFVRELLQDHGLKPYVMLTGSRGVHVVVPIKRLYTFDEVRAAALAIAQHAVDEHPEKFTIEVRKAKRKSRLFIDVLRNAWSATTVAPYAVRAYHGAPVAMPVTWQELAKINSSQKFTIATAYAKVKKSGDAWREMNRDSRVMPKGILKK